MAEFTSMLSRVRSVVATLCVASPVLGLANGCSGKNECSPRATTDTAGAFKADINNYGVCGSDGAILLFREGERTCAVRFSDVRPATDGCASYESWYRSDGNSSPTAPGGKQQEGEVQVFHARGIHPFVWLPGNHHVARGGSGRGLAVRFSPPNCAFISGESEPGEARTEFTVADTTLIEEVAYDNPKLKWYKVDTERETIVIEAPK
jgi:hypothetical protein